MNPTDPMRYFSVRQYFIDTQLPQMFCDDKPIPIERKQHQLLIYFCQRPDTIVSRDQIIDDINKGAVISDNAVNKMIASLRQLLGDNPKQPEFIKTIPRQGYSFIAPVEVCDSIKKPLEIKNKTNVIVAALLLVVALLITVVMTRDDNPSQPQNNKLVPLTRNSGVEFSPYMSPDGRFLAYTRNEPTNKIAQLWLKDLQNDNTEHLLANLASSTEIAWSALGDRLIYTDYPNQTCQFNQIQIKEGQPQPTTAISDCNARYVQQLIFTDDDQSLYFVSRVIGFEPMQIFRMNLQDNTRQLINQPALAGAGNYSMDISHDGSKLLILSSNADFQTTLYQLDRKTNELSTKGKWQRFLNRAIWHHDNESIVHTSNQYSHELLQSDVWGEKIGTIASTSNRVAENYRRHPNGKDFYFTSFMMNNDNVVINLKDNSKKHNFNSAVYDKLPTFSTSVDKWFFASKRNGITQIFSASEPDQQLKQLTNYDKEPSLASLDVSPNGQRLLALGTKQVTLMTIDGEKIRSVTVPSGLVLAAHWLSDNQIAVSAIDNEQPQLFMYQLDTGSLTTADQRWQAAFASPSGKRWFYIDRANDNVFEWDKQAKSFVNLGINLEFVYGSGLNIKATETALIYGRSVDESREFTRVDLETSQTKVLGQWLYVAGFDVLEQSLVLSYEYSRTGDIVVTAF
ncbi:MAG: winged helix-turn-helix domain-containing protein [Psychrosphaera sp.]|nr:winged helix-turn-helix domain-containing protein [Psychrosphaera sp.]